MAELALAVDLLHVLIYSKDACNPSYILFPPVKVIAGINPDRRTR